MNTPAFIIGSDQQPLKILIVEDDKVYSRLAVDVLEGTQRYTANTGKRGIELFAHLRPDITFIDIGLPDANGLDVLAHMKKTFPEAFIVVLTASRVSDDVEKAKYLGAAGYIIKPFNRGKVRTYLELYHNYVRELEKLDSTALSDMYRECFEKADALQLSFEARQTPMQLRHKERELLLRSWRILYVDSDAETAARVMKRVEQSGCIIEFVSGMPEALVALSRFQYHLLFISQELGEQTGIKLIKEIRLAGLEVPVVLITEDRLLPSDSTIRHLNIAAFILKPLKYNSFLGVISDQIERYLDAKGEDYVT